jgi:hypothetical protein
VLRLLGSFLLTDSSSLGASLRDLVALELAIRPVCVKLGHDRSAPFFGGVTGTVMLITDVPGANLIAPRRYPARRSVTKGTVSPISLWYPESKSLASKGPRTLTVLAR